MDQATCHVTLYTDVRELVTIDDIRAFLKTGLWYVARARDCVYQLP